MFKIFHWTNMMLNPKKWVFGVSSLLSAHIWCTWKIGAYGAHIKSSPLILDLTSIVV
jgi:hypothetical protein